MRAFIIACCTFFFLSRITFSDGFKTVDGKEYKNVTVSRTEPDGIASQEAVRPQQEQSEQRQSEELRVEIIQVLPNGILAYLRQMVDYSSGRGHYVPHQSGRIDKNIFLQGVSAGRAESDRLRVWAYHDGTYTYTDTNGASRTLEKWIVLKVF